MANFIHTDLGGGYVWHGDGAPVLELVRGAFMYQCAIDVRGELYVTAIHRDSYVVPTASMDQQMKNVFRYELRRRRLDEPPSQQ
jgi:hypothetical protein